MLRRFQYLWPDAGQSGPLSARCALGHYYSQLAEKYKIEYLEPGDAIETNELDGIHYSAKGHAAMAELMEKKIREILP